MRGDGLTAPGTGNREPPPATARRPGAPEHGLPSPRAVTARGPLSPPGTPGRGPWGPPGGSGGRVPGRQRRPARWIRRPGKAAGRSGPRASPAGRSRAAGRQPKRQPLNSAVPRAPLPPLVAVMKIPASWAGAARGTVTVATVRQVVPSVDSSPV